MMGSGGRTRTGMNQVYCMKSMDLTTRCPGWWLYDSDLTLSRLSHSWSWEIKTRLRHGGGRWWQKLLLLRSSPSICCGCYFDPINQQFNRISHCGLLWYRQFSQSTATTTLSHLPIMAISTQRRIEKLILINCSRPGILFEISQSNWINSVLINPIKNLQNTFPPSQIRIYIVGVDWYITENIWDGSIWT